MKSTSGLSIWPEELAGVGRQRLDVAALALGVDRVERQRRLARPRQAGEDDELVAGQLERDVAEVVLPGAPDHQLVGHSAVSYPGVTTGTRVRSGPRVRRRGVADHRERGATEQRDLAPGRLVVAGDGRQRPVPSSATTANVRAPGPAGDAPPPPRLAGRAGEPVLGPPRRRRTRAAGTVGRDEDLLGALGERVAGGGERVASAGSTNVSPNSVTTTATPISPSCEDRGRSTSATTPTTPSRNPLSRM